MRLLVAQCILFTDDHAPHQHCTISKRSFDVSKQVIGQMFVHGVNVLISGVVAEVASGNACVLYFLNILIDTTFGKFMIRYCVCVIHI